MKRTAYPVVILAGGLATRLGAISSAMPKSLVDVNGKPFIAHQLGQLRDQGIHQVVLCVGYLGKCIEEVVQDGRTFDLAIRYSFDGPRLLGTGGALQRALPQVDAPAFFVLYGDSYLDCDYADVQEAFQASGKPALMTVYRNEDRWDASNIEFADGRILAYDKKHRTPQMRHIDYGLGVLSTGVFSRVPDEEPYDLAALYQALLREGRLAGLEVFQRFYEIGSMAGLAETRRYLSNRVGCAPKRETGGRGAWTTSSNT
jgi:NDP-sugar pyrophosphorylase family protein